MNPTLLPGQVVLTVTFWDGSVKTYPDIPKVKNRPGKRSSGPPIGTTCRIGRTRGRSHSFYRQDGVALVEIVDDGVGEVTFTALEASHRKFHDVRDAVAWFEENGPPVLAPAGTRAPRTLINA